MFQKYIFPYRDVYLPLSTKEKWAIFKGCFWINMSTVLVFTIALLIISKTEYKSELQALMKSYSLNDMNPVRFLISALLLAPVLEELFFRGFLTFTRILSSVSFALFVFALVTICCKGLLVLPSVYFIVLRISVFMGAFLLFYTYLYLNVIPFLERWRELIYIFVALLFGLVHIFNYTSFTFSQFYWMPVLVFPQLVYGFTFGYIRLKNGLIWSILLHMATNMVPVLLRVFIRS